MTPAVPPAETQRSGENTSQSCDIPGFLKLGWSAKHLPVVWGGGEDAGPPHALGILLPPLPHPSRWLRTLSPQGCRGLSSSPPGQSRPCATLPRGRPPEHPSLCVQLNPILPDLEYLGDQHLLLSIKGVESCESYGACGMVAWGLLWWDVGCQA